MFPLAPRSNQKNNQDRECQERNTGETEVELLRKVRDALNDDREGDPPSIQSETRS